MRNYSLIKSILTEPWAISELSIEMFAPLVAGLFNKNIEFTKEDPLLPETKSAHIGSGVSSSQEVININVLRVSGALTKNDQFCGPTGMQTMQKWLANADKNPEIGAHIIVFDTPGGTVAGTNEFANVIKDTKKPIIAFVEDMACSAGYWLASQCNLIIANNNHAQIGSIGVMMSFADAQPYYESLGVKFHTINAPQSSEKNKIYDDLRAGKYDQYKNDVLKPLADTFINTIKEARPSVEDSQLTGAVYFAHNVVGTLVDEIGNFDYAVQRAAELVSQNKADNSNSASNTGFLNPNINMKKLINQAIGEDVTPNAEGNYLLIEAQAEAIEQAITTGNAAIATVATHEATIATHVATIDTQTQTIAAHEATIAELEGKPGAETIAAPKSTNAVIEENSEDTGLRSSVSDVTDVLKSIR